MRNIGAIPAGFGARLLLVALLLYRLLLVWAWVEEPVVCDCGSVLNSVLLSGSLSAYYYIDIKLLLKPPVNAIIDDVVYELGR